MTTLPSAGSLIRRFPPLTRLHHPQQDTLLEKGFLQTGPRAPRGPQEGEQRGRVGQFQQGKMSGTRGTPLSGKMREWGVTWAACKARHPTSTVNQLPVFLCLGFPNTGGITATGTEQPGSPPLCLVPAVPGRLVSYSHQLSQSPLPARQRTFPQGLALTEGCAQGRGRPHIPQQNWGMERWEKQLSPSPLPTARHLESSTGGSWQHLPRRPSPQAAWRTAHNSALPRLTQQSRDAHGLTRAHTCTRTHRQCILLMLAAGERPLPLGDAGPPELLPSSSWSIPPPTGAQVDSVPHHRAFPGRNTQTVQ